MKRYAKFIMIVLALALVQMACNFPSAFSRVGDLQATETPDVFATPTATLPPVITATSNPVPTHTLVPPTQAAPAATKTTAPTATRAPSSGSDNNTSGGGACTYRATFMEDISIPDDSLIQAGSAFTKTWRVRNDGSCTWGPNTNLHVIAFTGGNQLGARSQVELPLAVKPGQWVDVSVRMTAPNEAGSYTSNWMFLTNSGSYVGIGAQASEPLYTRIKVGSALTRVNFASGATAKNISGSLAANETKGYVLGAQKDQVIIGSVSSATPGVKLKVTAGNGAALQNNTGQDGTSVTVALPSTQDYILWVSAGNQAANFSLAVTIPSRIRFAPGGISAAVDGTVSGHMQVSYILRAAAGQTMTVDLIGSNVGLTIYGMTDGTPLVRAEGGATSWTGKLPATQDYILIAVPAVDSTTFTLKVKIE